MSTTEIQVTVPGRRGLPRRAARRDASERRRTRLYDHVAECDACRDLKHEAALVAGRVRDAGADFRPADDFLDKLVDRLAAARPESPQATAPEAPASSGPVAASTLAAAPAEVEPSMTLFDPLAEAKVAEAEASSRRSAVITQPSGVSATVAGAPVAPEHVDTDAAEPLVTMGAAPPDPRESAVSAQNRAVEAELGRRSRRADAA